MAVDELTGWEITERDDAFHNDIEGSDHPWWTETFWASFNVPERKMGGWFYNQVLPNQGEHGTCNGGAWVWDDSDASALYEVNHQGLAMPAGEHDLRDIQLPNGNHLQMIEPLQKYRVRYNDAGKFEADLYLEGIMPPNPHPAGCAPFWKGRHFDQPMHVTGEIVLHGETIHIDCFTVRDRSWSPRKPRNSAAANDASKGKEPTRKPAAPTGEHSDISLPLRKPFTIGYFFGTASETDAFLVYTMLIEGEEDRGDFTNTGYLLRDGVYAHLVEGKRECLVDPESGYIWRIEYHGVDTLGRKLDVVGEEMSKHGRHSAGLFHWEWNGASGWGENQGGIAPSHVRQKRT